MRLLVPQPAREFAVNNLRLFDDGMVDPVDCPTYDPPFPYYGGKSRVASYVWAAFGPNVDNYVEPFGGSLAMLMRRPSPWSGAERVNDLGGWITNFWRAVKFRPAEVAAAADWPINENDLHARHAVLMEAADWLPAMLEGDPAFCDPKLAGWWAWGLCIWIGGGFGFDIGRWVRRRDDRGIMRLVPAASAAERGVRRKLPHQATFQGVTRSVDLYRWFDALSERLRRVRICHGDWTRVVTTGAFVYGSRKAVFLDPPYPNDLRAAGLYSEADDGDVAWDVAEWAVTHGDDYRIVVAGYGHPSYDNQFPNGWQRIRWSSSGATLHSGDHHASRQNRHMETLWLSPTCRRVRVPADD